MLCCSRLETRLWTNLIEFHLFLNFLAFAESRLLLNILKQ